MSGPQLRREQKQQEQEKTPGQERGLEPERDQGAKKNQERELDRGPEDDFEL